MKCEVRNVQSAEVFAIPPEGVIFGRTGGPANITVSDQSVSKRHARIYLKDGQWLLEDLKSVNGTVVNNRRITEPVPLTPGFVFALSKHQFEIVSMDGAALPRTSTKNGESDPRRGGGGGGGGRPAPPTQPPRRQSPPAPSGQPVQVPDAEPLLPPEPSRSRQQPQPSYNDPGDVGDYGDDAGQGGGAGAVIAALPRAIAYYLAAIPLMALNPLGTIRRGIEEPKLKAMGPIELIAFFLPVQLFANLVTAWAVGIGTLIGGGGFIFSAFIPIVPLIVAVVASVISGLITHPLLRFVIERIFKGETDETTRTNYMVMIQTASALISVPTAVAAILTPVIARLSASFAPIALLLIIPALLMAVTTPLIPFISWSWMKAFKVADIWKTIFLILLILSALGGVGLMAKGVIGAISTMTSGTSTTISLKDDKPPKDDDGKPPKDDVKPPKDDTPEATPPPSLPTGKYGEYRRKRDFVEKAIAEDPMLLRGSVRVKYEELSRCNYAGVADAELDVLGKKKQFKPELRLLLERVKDQKIYERCRVTVEELYKLINR